MPATIRTAEEERQTLTDGPFCEGATWVEHHRSGNRAILCARLTGEGGALYLSPDNSPCRRCRFNKTGEVRLPTGQIVPADDPRVDGSDLVDRIARAMAVPFGPDKAEARVLLRALLRKGNTGVDLTRAEARLLFQKVLLRATRQGLDPEDALQIAVNEGIA